MPRHSPATACVMPNSPASPSSLRRPARVNCANRYATTSAGCERMMADDEQGAPHYGRGEPAAPCPSADARLWSCPHMSACPPPQARGRQAARVVASRPEQGWSLLCNGVVVFDDTGALLPDGSAIEPDRWTRQPATADTAQAGEDRAVAPGPAGRGCAGGLRWSGPVTSGAALGPSSAPRPVSSSVQQAARLAGWRLPPPSPAGPVTAEFG